CLVHEVGETPSFKVVIVDIAGNFISNVKSSLYLASASTPDLLTTKLAPDSATFETPTAPGVLGAGPAVRNPDVAHTLKFSKSGFGTITIFVAESDLPDTEDMKNFPAGNRSITYGFETVAAAPTELRMGPAVTPVVAGESFSVKLTLHDANGNIVRKTRTAKESVKKERYYEAISFTKQATQVEARIFSSANLAVGQPCHKFLQPGEFDALTDKTVNFLEGEGLISGFTLTSYRSTDGGGDQPRCDQYVAGSIKLPGQATAMTSSQSSTHNAHVLRVVPDGVDRALFRAPSANGPGFGNTGSTAMPVVLGSGTNCAVDANAQIPACQLPIVSTVANPFYVAAYDKWGNYINDVKADFTWVAIPKTGTTVAAAHAYADSNILQKPCTDTQCNSVNVIFSKLPSDTTLAGTGLGRLKATFKKANGDNVDILSTALSLSTQMAVKYQVQLLQPNPSLPDNQLTVVWDSKNNAISGIAGMQLLAGSPFYIRLRPLDATSGDVDSYIGVKEIFFVSQMFTSWGEPSILPNLPDPDGSYDNDERFVCNFVVVPPPAGSGKSECILSKKSSQNADMYADGAVFTKKAFKILDSARVHVFSISDETKISNVSSTTILNPVLTSVQAIPDASSRNLRFGNNCGGRANGAKSWEVHQDGLVSNPNTTKPVPFLQSLNSYAVTADEELILFPSATDSVGNWLNDLNNASFVQESHSSGLTLANFIQTQHDQTATACPTGHTKIVFKADTATEKLSAPKITLRGDHGTGSSSISSFINLVIKPGVPKDLRVRFGTDAENEADVVEAPTTVTAGQCFRPMVSVRDANGNLVHNFTGGVNMNLFLMDYYNDANVSPKKQLVQPGGIYKRTGSGTQAMYVPITSLESHVQATSFTPSGSSTTYTAASHTSSSAMDPEPITYYASESSARIVSDGILKVSDRYV
ncbi:MAG: hypothetical protein RI953_2017, partial [Pseudomonadota bacterium]